MTSARPEQPSGHYETRGRVRQKQRTRDALVAALHELMAQDGSPSIEEVAESAGVSRTTAYRYFPDRAALIRAAYPQIDEPQLFTDDVPDRVEDRVARVVEFQIELIERWSAQLRSALWSSLLPDAAGAPLRAGRAIGWFEEALRPQVGEWTEDRIRRVAVRLRATVGIEPWVWLVDVAGLEPAEAKDVLRANATAVLRAALDGR